MSEYNKKLIDEVVNLNMGPGEIFLKVIIEMVAKKSHMSYEDIGAFLTGELKVTKEIDESFSKTFRTPPGFWLDLQKSYDEHQESRDTIIC